MIFVIFVTFNSAVETNYTNTTNRRYGRCIHKSYFLCFVTNGIKYLYTQHTRSALNPFNSCCIPEQRVRTSSLNLGDSDSTHTPLTTHTLALF